jgi:hypothetical protein
MVALLGLTYTTPSLRAVIHCCGMLLARATEILCDGGSDLVFW